jgi:hypothetical protein
MTDYHQKPGTSFHQMKDFATVSPLYYFRRYIEGTLPAIAKALRKHMEAKRGDIIKRFCEQAEKALDVDLGVSIRIREPS